MKSILKFVVAILVTLGSFGAQAQNHGQYNKLWWGGDARSGEGTPISHQVQVNADGSKVDKLFGVWFHYGPTGDGVWLTFTCQSLTKDTLGRDTCSGQLLRVRGPQPMVFNPNGVSVTAPGTFTITFNSPTSSTFVYNFDNQSGSIAWVPQIFATDATALHYTDKVLGTWTANYPYLITKTGVTKLVNKTQYTLGVNPLFNCELASLPLTDGKVLTRCTNAVATTSTPANSRVVSYANLNSVELLDFTGVIPADIVWRSIENNADKPEWKAKARVSDGWFFTPVTATASLRFQPDVGATFVVKEGSVAVDGNINIMIAYTN